MASASGLDMRQHSGRATGKRWGQLLSQRLLLGCLLVMATGCNIWDTSARVESVTPAASGADLELPRDWQSVTNNALHPTADFQAYHAEKDIYLIVLREDQARVAAPDNLSEQAQNYIGLMEAQLNRFTVAEAAPERISISGAEAMQYEVTGEFLGEDVAYLHNTVKANDGYYQVVAWTPQDRYRDNINAMKTVVQELRFE